MKTKASAVVLSLFLLIACGCTKRTSAEPSKLMGKLYSGQSLQTVQRKLDLSAGDWQVLQDERSLNTSGQKPSRLYVISKKPFVQYGDSGELMLTFYNDELVATQFYPSNLESFREQAQSDDKIDLSAGENKIAPSTRVWVGKDDAGRSYIGWIDKVRQNEMSGAPAQR